MRPDLRAAAWSIAEAPIRSGLESCHLSVEPDPAASAYFLTGACALAVLWLAVHPAGAPPPTPQSPAHAARMLPR